MERLKACPLCDAKQFKEHLVVKDYFLSKEEFQLCRCVKCDLIFTNPRPNSEEITEYYRSTEYISHSNNTDSLTSIIYKGVRSYTLKKKYQLINKYLSPRPQVRHLDYGCGTGHFINYTTKKGWISYGYEPDETALSASSYQVKPLIYNDLGSISKHKYDIISLFHVLEHVHNLEQILKLLLAQLKDQGLLILALPNHKSYDANYYKEHWAGYDVPRHLYHFNQNSIQQLAKIYGLKIEHCEPMRFDSYYVSILSEKYQSHNASFIKGIKAGLASNTSAALTSEFSSIIYILRK